jgi:predicted ATPase
MYEAVPGGSVPPVAKMEIPQGARKSDGHNEAEWLASLRAYEAIELFSERAQAVMPSFALTAHNADVISQICSTLDGIPLSIELAAAWSSVLTPEQILERLTERRFDLLISRQRAPSERHRSLWETLDQSCRLLSPQVRDFLARTSIFRGGWTIEVAEAVCILAATAADQPRPTVNALQCLAVLHERSLVQTHFSGNTMRYSLLETVREYASELLAMEDREHCSSAHTAHFIQLAEAAAAQLIGPKQVDWLGRLEDEQNNMRAALGWCAQSADRTELGLHLCRALWRFWDIRGHHIEGIEWINTFLVHEQTVSVPLRGTIYETMGLLYAGLRNFYLAQEWSLKAFEIFSAIGDEDGKARALCTLGISETNLALPEDARVRFEQCLPMLEHGNNPYEYARALSGLGCLALSQRAFDTARPILQQAVDNYRVCGNLHGMALTGYRLGGIAVVNHQYALAHELFTEALARTREVRDTTALPFGLFHIARNSMLQGDFDRARSYFNEAIDCCRAYRNYPVEGTSMVMLGDMALLEKEVDIACGHYIDALVPFNSQYTQDASGHVAFRLVGVLLAQNHANHAVRLLAHAASKLVPIRAADLPYGFMLYMCLGYLYLDQDIFQEYVTALKLQLPETFDTLWNEGYQLTHTDGIGYIKSVVQGLSER